jgi:hypothetical protein
MLTNLKARSQDRQAILEIGILLLGLMVVLAGCQTMKQRDMGKIVPTGNQVVIKSGGPFEQRFQTNDMNVSYQYRTAGNQLKVWGTTSLRYESLDVLVFHLYFLDEKGAVIEIHNFFSFLDHSDFVLERASNRQFHRDFTVPAGAKAYAIGYDGKTGHDKDQDAITFSYYPFD